MGALSGKVAWVTGAGSGIGQAGAIALAEAGARVILSGRTRETLVETEAQIHRTGSGASGASMEQLDVSDLAAVQAAGKRIEDEYERLDILVNSAGINLPNRHWSDVSPEAWAKLIDVNLNGATYCIATVLPMMRRQQDGLVINIASWAGRYTSQMAGVAYCASKHGMVSMNASLNMEECVNGIRACTICPAEVATPIMRKRPTAPSEEDLAKMLQPEDLGKLIAFIAQLPPHVCLNEVLISPTWNRAYLGGADLERKNPQKN